MKTNINKKSRFIWTRYFKNSKIYSNHSTYCNQESRLEMLPLTGASETFIKFSSFLATFNLLKACALWLRFLDSFKLPAASADLSDKFSADLESFLAPDKSLANLLFFFLRSFSSTNSFLGVLFSMVCSCLLKFFSTC